MNIYLILIILSIVVLIHWVRETNEDASLGNILWVFISVVILFTNVCLYAYHYEPKDNKKSNIATETLIVDEK